ncbi:MAG: serine/threonine protein kinase [Planctomycetaceae bacterium]
MNTSCRDDVAADDPRRRGGDNEPVADDPRIVEVLEEYLGELEKGQRPDWTQYVQRYPELADHIAECLESLEFVQMTSPNQMAQSNEMSLGGVLRRWLEAHPGPLGDFQILRELGRGGMGVVYEAMQISLGRRVALKVLPFASTFDARQLQRFKNEAQAAAMLHHPHIVAVHAVGCERGVHFYAMQLIEGQSLAVVVRQLREQARKPSPGQVRRQSSDAEQPQRGSPLPQENSQSTIDVSAALTAGTSATCFRKFARLMVQAAEALEHAHQLGVVHRDVKPANLLVNASGNLWVTDFGLAQLQADNGLTRSGDLLGTLRYMSPEQTSGQTAVLDHRTDIYSLGATMYELLTLEPVFDGESRHALVYQILHQEPRAPRQVNRVIPIELETIVLKALSKSPDDRYRTAAELAADLQRYLDDQPIRARRPSVVDRVRKWSRRHPSAVVASVLLLAVVAVSLLISNRLISREQQKTAAALAGEKLRADQAAGQLRQARHTVEALIQVSEKDLANKSGVQALCLQLLKNALAYYQDFNGNRIDLNRWHPDMPAVQAGVERTLHLLIDVVEESNTRSQEMTMLLLWSAPVLEDIGLSADQGARVVVLRQSWLDDCRATAEKLAVGESATGRRGELGRLAVNYDRLLSECLTTAQTERLRQIVFQAAMLSAVDSSGVIESLNLPREAHAAASAFREIEFNLPVTAPADSQLPGRANRRDGAPDVVHQEAISGTLAYLSSELRKMSGAPFSPFRGLSVSRALPAPD